MVNLVKITELVRFDWFIKYMFRDKSDFDILEGFLSELLKEDIQILEILESESNQSRKNDKFNRVDIMVKDAKGELIIVEVQNNEEYDYLQRILFGTSKTIVDNIVKGETYSKVKKVISVSVVYFQAGQGDDYIYRGTTIFRGIHTHDELVLSDEQIALFGKQKPQDLYPEYYLIKAGDFNENAINNTLDEWIYFLKTGKVKEGFKAKGIDKAKQKLEVAKLSPRKRAAYERDTKHLHSEASWAETQNFKQQQLLKKAKEEIREEIREEVKEEIREEVKEEIREEVKEEIEKDIKLEANIKTAMIMKADNEPIEKVMKYTGLSQEQIEKL